MVKMAYFVNGFVSKFAKKVLTPAAAVEVAAGAVEMAAIWVESLPELGYKIRCPEGIYPL